jgi:circadian clock protein KaiB
MPRKSTVPKSKTDEYVDAIADRNKDFYVLRLYVVGQTARSTQAINNIRKVCDEYLQGHCDLQVIDLYQQPVLAKGEQIVATPTLIRNLPAPMRKLIGNLSNIERILVGLDLQVKT